MSKGTKLTTSWKKELSRLPVSQSHICNCTKGPAADGTDAVYPPGHISVGQRVYHKLVKILILWHFTTFWSTAWCPTVSNAFLCWQTLPSSQHFYRTPLLPAWECRHRYGKGSTWRIWRWAPTSLKSLVTHSWRGACSCTGENVGANGKTAGKQAFPWFSGPGSQPTLGRSRGAPAKRAKPQPKTWAWEAPNGPSMAAANTLWTLGAFKREGLGRRHPDSHYRCPTV